ncbi:sigma-54-dependent transcriptional regulator [Neobacillus sp. LXY-1]|uniref:sigma-54-dependent transcriptional regulator n=1 Tax=Neobacillus sp. LXY-1 TaxID=3379133 RepID=UPI003EE38295
MSNILVVDDESEICRFLNHLLTDMGHSVTCCTSGAEFDGYVSKLEYQLAFLDVRLPDRNGLDILLHLKKKQPHCNAIVMTGYSTVKTAIEAIKLGASDFIEKPFEDISDIEQLTHQLLTTTPSPTLSDAHDLSNRLGCFIGYNEEMQQLYTLAYKFAQKNVNVLIEGETGTGKEVLAHFIHQASQRSAFPYVAVNCGAISESLLESELFGHTKGAFTGAIKERKGYFELAGKGTLFLDEIGEASLATQVKLLRVLETGEFMKVGGEFTQRSKARLIAASHVDLQKAVASGTFREDLLYRLDVVRLTIPPLRNRLEDIPLFIQHYLKQQDLHLTYDNETMEYLCNYQWPGNMRELINVIKWTIALAEGETSIITPNYLPEKITNSGQPLSHTTEIERTANSSSSFSTEEYLRKWHQDLMLLWEMDRGVDLHKILDMIKSFESKTVQALIYKALQTTIGNRKEAADLLGISQRKLRYYLNEKK